MKRALICLFLCLLFIPLLGMKGGPGEGRTRCLLIGCDRFVSMPGTEPASANNVETMGALLADFLPEDATVSRMVNGPGTVAEFEILVTETFRDAMEADTALIYLSTHGLLREEAGGMIRRRVDLVIPLRIRETLARAGRRYGIAAAPAVILRHR